jgi:hypothetical protein
MKYQLSKVTFDLTISISGKNKSRYNITRTLNKVFK